MTDLLEALEFAWHCFWIYRRHQHSRGGIFSTYRRSFAEVPRVMMVLGTGREAWRVSEFAIHYLAERGAHENQD